jgi:hypothetical protein
MRVWGYECSDGNGSGDRSDREFDEHFGELGTEIRLS